MKPNLLKFLNNFRKFNYCPVCSKMEREFLPFGMMKVKRPAAKCSNCGSLERHRLIWLYFTEKTNLFKDKVRMLHIAPEKCFVEIFKSAPNIDYVTADIVKGNAMVYMDIQDIQYPDEYFDVIYCSHVLEHVPDDRKAIKELARVLNKSGWAILQVPIKYSFEETLEDPVINTPELRKKHYGLEDHLRQYGLDYDQRLRSAGFKVKTDKYLDIFSPKLSRIYSLPDKEYIYFCTKQ